LNISQQIVERSLKDWKDMDEYQRVGLGMPFDDYSTALVERDLLVV
jgi:hypothetical protein